MVERRTVLIRGIVQGVGFRPFIYNLAVRLGLGGWVKNQTGAVCIEVEGEQDALDRFLAELTDRPPTLAQIERLTWERQSPRGERRFRIDASEADGAGGVFISPDVAVCQDCLGELFDPADRRFKYPFLNCTNCGPRLTIIAGAPYDRTRTTMAGFPMCAACRAEYEDPTDRRFHAQPTACALCGPRLELRDAEGRPVASADPLGVFAAALLDGKIGALKGLGGYHLACDARNGAVVAELRRRKHRDEKPVAVMVSDLAAAEVLVEVGPVESALLRSPQCPIVLLCKRPTLLVAEDVAPRNLLLGVMLPYTPLHHLLLRAVGGAPLVMTSGNHSDEPIAFRDDEALEKLKGIADLFLVHNRPIHVRCDDSVTRVVDGIELPVRRSRGYAPQPIELPFPCRRPILAVGGQIKGTFTLGRDRQAFVSHHMGDLDQYDAYQEFVKDVALYQELFAVDPQVIAHDLHPDYATTAYTRRRAAETSVALVAVQHHHAHLAACMAEHGLTAPVIGVTFDGTGYGTDGAVWGGEFLIGDYCNFRRAAHLRYVGLPGGEQAIREPWRMAVAHLADAGADCGSLRSRIPREEIRVVERMLERRFNTPPTSSAGRLFDAVASLAGVRDLVNYEGQAAMELEWLAESTEPDGVYPFEFEARSEAPLLVDLRPLICAVVGDVRKEVDAAVIARRFHSTMADLIGVVCGRIRTQTGLDAVVLSGGVFQNALLTDEATARLHKDGFCVFRHGKVPPNDGGLSLGQLAVATAALV